MIRAALLLLALSGPALAEDFPRLAAVTGVQANDVLNIRAEPDAGATIIGTLPPDATGVEVISVTDGWALVNTDEGSGYANMRFLRHEAGPAWHALSRPLVCSGTEPFWSFLIDPAAEVAYFETPDSFWEGGIRQIWPGTPFASSAALSMSEGTAVLRTAACSDGMSDHAFGIAVDLFLTGPAGGRLSGCCSLVPH